MPDISGFGTVVTIVASVTLAAGFSLTQFSDDTDAFDTPSIKIADGAMGLNGDFISWKKPVPIPVTISAIPGSVDDTYLQLIADANRVSQGHASVNDIITMSVVLPDLSTRTFSVGIMTDAPSGKSIASAGRLKTNSYSFLFQTVA